MLDNVIEFKSPVKAIAQFIRIGDAHRKMGELYAAGRLPVRRAIFDASRLKRQIDLVNEFRRNGVEIVLDPEIAELAAKEKFMGQAGNAPWATASEGKLLGPSFFRADEKTDIIGQIARFAVQYAVDTVLAPTHFLADPDFTDWFSIDVTSCLALRRALDREGGRNISIDYPIIHSHVLINDSTVRSTLIGRIADLPIDNVWIRASGLGNDPKPQTTKQFIFALHGMHNLGKPIVIDYLGGLMGQAVLAFGGASGLAHGIAEREQFNARSWHKEPKKRDNDDGFGRATYIPVPGLGRSFKSKELDLLASAKGGKRAVACQDTCCAHGIQDMKNDPRQHATRQSFAPIDALGAVPDLNRESYFLDKPLREAETLARIIKDLKPSRKDAERLDIDMESLKKRLDDHHRKIGKLGDTLGLMHDERGAGTPRALTCSQRGGNKSSNKREEK